MSTAKTLSQIASYAGSSLLTIALLTGCGTPKDPPASSSSSETPVSSSSSSQIVSSSSQSSSQRPLPSGPPVQSARPNADQQSPMYDWQTRAPGMTTTTAYDTEIFQIGLSVPWGIEFLPDGRALVTERGGSVHIVSQNGDVSRSLGGVPSVYTSFQGGMLDVSIAPDFETSRWVYLSYSENRGNNQNGTTVGRGRLSADESRLENFEVIFRQLPSWNSQLHFGSRLVWSHDGLLYVTLGERSLAEARGLAQELDNTLGKVVRLNADGSSAAGNPFSGSDVRSQIWSYGHRNMQAAAIHPETGELWTIEHGPQGGDELNKPEAGKNYGWPIITYGEDYFTGAPIGDGITRANGMEQPIYYWDPVIAPSGMEIYSGQMFDEWKNDIFVGSLTPGGVVRLMLRDDKVVGEEVLLTGRVRDVEQAPDGSLWVLREQSGGQIIRIFKR